MVSTITMKGAGLKINIEHTPSEEVAIFRRVGEKIELTFMSKAMFEDLSLWWDSK